MDKKTFVILIIIILFAFFVRFINLDFPFLSVEEARIANRGYALAKFGIDELGRKFPVIFNSLDDYQMPVVSYLTMTGVFVFGKTDLGIRLPFILIGTLLVYLAFKIAGLFKPKNNFQLISSFIVASSPTLIFLSKTPNTSIVLVFLFTLLFYLLANNKNLLIIILTIIVALFTSKLAWFVLLPFVIITVSIFQLQKKKKKLFILVLTVLLTTSVFVIFLTIPQAKRSLLENNFSIFFDVTIKNGINRLRGQGMESGWPNMLNRLMFNKLHFLTAGLIHWISHFNPAIYFGQFDSSGRMSFSFIGAWVKVVIIPFFLGLVFLVKSADKKSKLILLLLPVLTYPSIFMYPTLVLELIILVLPFMAIIITLGFTRIIQFNKSLASLIFLLIIFELTLNILNLSPEYKNTNMLRPGWIQKVANDVFNATQNAKTAISDDIVADIVPVLQWSTPVNSYTKVPDVLWPYKFRQYNMLNIKVIGSDEDFEACGKDELLNIFASKRDLDKIQKVFDIKITNTYKDNLQQNKVSFIRGGVCIN